MEKIYCKKKLNRHSKYKFLESYFMLDAPTTFYEDGTIQCGAGRGRSFADLLLLTKSYFKTTAEEEVAWILWKLCLKYDNQRTRKGNLSCLACGDINKISFKMSMGYWSFRPFSNNSSNTGSIFTSTDRITDEYSIIKILKLALTYEHKRK